MKRCVQKNRGFLFLQGVFVFVLGAFFFPGGHVDAAKLFLDPPTSEYPAGDTFMVPLRIDPEGVCVNAIEVTMQYDSETLTAIDVGRGNSILTLWTEEPFIDKDEGVVSFSGGVPGGYCGRVVGDPGQTNVLGNIVFTTNGVVPKGGASTTLSIVRSSVLENDGRGSALPTTVQGTTIRLIENENARSNEWLEFVKDDVIAPELFDVVLSSSPAVANGKKFVVFSAVDKQSGIDHYEVLETDPKRFGFLTWISRESHWIVAKSPYILRDQSLRSSILIKAIDKAGNERVVTYRAPEELIQKSPWGTIMAFVVALGIGGVLFLLYKIVMARREGERGKRERTTNDDSTNHE